MPSTEQRYWLTSHVHICVIDDCAVLLDLRQDKFIGIGREYMPALAALVLGWPMVAQSKRPAAPSANNLLRQMLSAGILTMDPMIGKEARPPSICHPTQQATEPDLEYQPRRTIRDASQVLIAAALARALVKWRPIDAVVGRVQHRKRRSWATGDFDLDAARPFVDSFLYWRPLFFTSKDECLFDSLVLLELLARKHLFPTWVFGVSMNPFRAHSWVQTGDRVLNDLPERVARFTPILAV